MGKASLLYHSFAFASIPYYVPDSFPYSKNPVKIMVKEKSIQKEPSATRFRWKALLFYPIFILYTDREETVFSILY